MGSEVKKRNQQQRLEYQKSMNKLRMPASLEVYRVYQRSIKDLHQWIRPGYLAAAVSALSLTDDKTKHRYQTRDPNRRTAIITGRTVPDGVSMMKTHRHCEEKRTKNKPQNDNKDVLNNHTTVLRQVFSLYSPRLSLRPPNL